MLWYISLQIVAYISILILLHYLYNYLKDTFTVKRTKDLVSLHQEKYQEILNELKELGQRNQTTQDDFDQEFLESSLTKLIETI
jgi:uncharacterized protein YoxC